VDISALLEAVDEAASRHASPATGIASGSSDRRGADVLSAR
jgi:hypothetical protein